VTTGACLPRLSEPLGGVIDLTDLDHVDLIAGRVLPQIEGL